MGMGRAEFADHAFDNGIAPPAQRRFAVIVAGHAYNIHCGGHIDLPVITPLR